MIISWDAVGAIGEVLGALAVLVSLAYLAVQVRASTVSARAASVREVIAQWDHAVDQLWADRDMAAMMRTALRGEAEALSREEVLVFAIRLSHVVQIHIMVLEMTEAGFMSEQFLDRVNNAVVWLLSSPGGSAWWRETGYMMPNHGYIDQLLESYPLKMGFSEWDDTLYEAVMAAQTTPQ